MNYYLCIELYGSKRCVEYFAKKYLDSKIRPLVPKDRLLTEKLDEALWCWRTPYYLVPDDAFPEDWIDFLLNKYEGIFQEIAVHHLVLDASIFSIIAKYDELDRPHGICLNESNIKRLASYNLSLQIDAVQLHDVESILLNGE